MSEAAGPAEVVWMGVICYRPCSGPEGVRNLEPSNGMPNQGPRPAGHFDATGEANTSRGTSRSALHPVPSTGDEGKGQRLSWVPVKYESRTSARVATLERPKPTASSCRYGRGAVPLGRWEAASSKRRRRVQGTPRFRMDSDPRAGQWRQ